MRARAELSGVRVGGGEEESGKGIANAEKVAGCHFRTASRRVSSAIWR